MHSSTWKRWDMEYKPLTETQRIQHSMLALESTDTVISRLQDEARENESEHIERSLSHMGLIRQHLRLLFRDSAMH